VLAAVLWADLIRLVHRTLLPDDRLPPRKERSRRLSRDPMLEAAVCPSPQTLQTSWMQPLGREFKVSSSVQGHTQGSRQTPPLSRARFRPTRALK
jgi:hypothetical protein